MDHSANARIPYGRQSISKQDCEAVLEVLQSDFLTQGPCVPQFEEVLCSISGAKHAVAMHNATACLHLACQALGLGKGDWLWTSPISFVASSNAGLYCGAQVDFVDIDPKTYNISIEALRKKLEKAKKESKLPKVFIPVHLTGEPCDMAEIKVLSREYGFSIVEDAAHAIGARYQESTIGDCRYSDVTVFSFHPVKIVTTAEGGAALTNNAQLAEKMRLLRSHGITRDPSLFQEEPDGAWYYEMLDLGYHFRMTEMQAALGISQLNRLEEFLDKRHLLAQRYDEAFLGHPSIQPPYRSDESYSALHLYVIRVPSKCRKDLFEHLRAKGILVNVHYIPIPAQPYYKKIGHSVLDYPAALDYYKESISLPMFPELSYQEQEFIIRTLLDYFV